MVGVERDEQAVATARRRAAKSGLGNFEFVCGDFREVEIDGGRSTLWSGASCSCTRPTRRTRSKEPHATSAQEGWSHLRRSTCRLARRSRSARVEKVVVGDHAPVSSLGAQPRAPSRCRRRGYRGSARARVRHRRGRRSGPSWPQDDSVRTGCAHAEEEEEESEPIQLRSDAPAFALSEGCRVGGFVGLGMPVAEVLPVAHPLALVGDAGP